MAKYGRKLTSQSIKARILLSQEGRCAYCNSNLQGQGVQWDHFIPWSYLDGSGGDGNWVAACSTCNRKKYNFIFRDESDVYEFSMRMIQSHGSLGEGWGEDTGNWQSQLLSQSTPAV